MKKLKSVLIVLLALAVFCACGAAETLEENILPGDTESSGEEAPEKSVFDAFEKFVDIAGERIDFEGEAMRSFELDYVIGWNLTSDEYVKLRPWNEIFGSEVVYASSRYTINYGIPRIGTETEAVCDSCEYSFSPSKGIPGIFVLEKQEYDPNEPPLETLCFYPYYFENGEGFYLLQERNEFSERELSEAENLVLSDGTEKKVQPVSILCRNSSDNTALTAELLGELYGADLDKELCYLEATVFFDHLVFIGQSQASGESVYRTFVSGTVYKIDAQ